MTLASEQNLTLAVDAAAKEVYETNRAQAQQTAGHILPTWDELDPLAKNEFRNFVLPIVHAALKAIPDPRHEAFEEGLAAGLDADPQTGDGGTPNPYPSGL